MAIFIAAMGTAFGFGGTAGAQDTIVTAVSGSAFGIDAEGLVQIDKEPFVELPEDGTDDPITDRTARVDLSPVITVDLLEVQTDGETGEDGFSESEARVSDVLLLGDPLDAATDGALSDLLDDLLGGGGGDLLGGDLLGGGDDDDDDGLLDDLLGDDGLLIEAIETQCRATADGVEASTNVVGLTDQEDDDDGEIIELDDEELEIDLGPLLRIVLNEQEETNEDGFREITVNGARITLLGDGDDIDEADDDAVLDIILAQSHCDVEFEEVEPPTTTTPSTTTPSTTTPPTTTPPTTTPDDGDDNESRNESDVSNESDGTAIIETGDANAVGNISDTDIDQTANAAGGAGGSTGGDADVDQDATVINEGTAGANTGGNAAIGNNSVNIADNVQSSFASSLGTTTTGTIPGHNSASNDSDVSNDSNGTAVVDTGDANAVGNISDTDIDQTGNAAGGPGGSEGGDADVDQDATVVNAGDAAANTGGNAAIGNNSTNVASNDQAAVAVDDDTPVDPCCPQPDDGPNSASNDSNVSNESDGTAVVESGDAGATGNSSDTDIDQTANAAGGAGSDDDSDCEDSPCDDERECDCEPCPKPEPEPCKKCPEPEPEPDPCKPDCGKDPCKPDCGKDPCKPDCGEDDPCKPCGGECNPHDWENRGFGGSSSASQSATVVNSGSASANSGGNVAVGNNSTNVATNTQTAVSSDDD